MSKINTGILYNAAPLSAERIGQLEKQVLENKETFAYLDENSELCFAMSTGVEGIKDLAWHNAYELTAENDLFTKKVYNKTGLKTYEHKTTLTKQSLTDNWQGEEPTEVSQVEALDGTEYYTMAPSTLSFRSTAPLDEFQEVQVNGQVVDSSNYTLEEGSTIVKLSVDYLKTLEQGNHEVAIISNNQTAKGSFTVSTPRISSEYGVYYGQPYCGSKNDHTYLLILESDSLARCIDLTEDSTEIANIEFDGRAIIDMLGGAVLFGYTATPSTWSISVGRESYTFSLNSETVADDNFIYTRLGTLAEYSFAPKDSTIAYLNVDKLKSNINGLLVTGLSGAAFSGNTNITNITIPETITSIGGNAFGGCTNLASVEIPNGVTTIGLGAFTYCTSLTSIVIPDSVTGLPGACFQNCTNLTSITIGSGVTSFQASTFAGCFSLIDITFKGTMAQWTAASRMALFWNDGIPVAQVKCSDGVVTLSSAPSVPPMPA